MNLADMPPEENPEPDDPELDALVATEVERALAPGKGVLPAEVLDEMRILLDLGLRYNPDARKLLDELRPTRSVLSSNKIQTAANKGRKARAS